MSYTSSNKSSLDLSSSLLLLLILSFSFIILFFFFGNWACSFFTSFSFSSSDFSSSFISFSSLYLLYISFPIELAFLFSVLVFLIFLLLSSSYFINKLNLQAIQLYIDKYNSLANKFLLISHSLVL